MTKYSPNIIFKFFSVGEVILHLFVRRLLWVHPRLSLLKVAIKSVMRIHRVMETFDRQLSFPIIPPEQINGVLYLQ